MAGPGDEGAAALNVLATGQVRRRVDVREAIKEVQLGAERCDAVASRGGKPHLRGGWLLVGQRST